MLSDEEPGGFSTMIDEPYEAINLHNFESLPELRGLPPEI